MLMTRRKGSRRRRNGSAEGGGVVGGGGMWRGWLDVEERAGGRGFKGRANDIVNSDILYCL